MLASALLKPVLLPEPDKPPVLGPASLVQEMFLLSRRMFQEGSVQPLAELLNDRIIETAGSLELLKIAIQSETRVHGFRKAVRRFEQSGKTAFTGDIRISGEWQNFRLQLYKEWIQWTIDQEWPLAGWEPFDAARRIFSDDVELHLLGVELAIAARDWSRAEAMLKERSYPESHKDRAAAMEVIVLERKVEEDMITLRFSAGSDLVPVDVMLNKRLMQKFVIDTGATIVSIPSETADRLGLTIDDRTPVKVVATVSGYDMAYEVRLDFMEIKGLRLTNVNALIIDMPGLPGVGLLGQSFLQHFQVEIDSKRGILRLGRR
jgi:clan AA aspartic protease (TIGR02281 family)